MKWIWQFMIIVLFAFLGEVLRVCIPVMIPAGIYGLLLLFSCLCLNIIRIEQVENVATFLVEIMPICFIPASVGLMTKWNEIKALIVPISVSVVFVTILVIIVTGHTAQFFVRRKERKVKSRG